MISHVDNFFSTEVVEFTQSLQQLESNIESHQLPKDDENLADLKKAIFKSRDACRNLEATLRGSSKVLKDAQSKFREAINPWFNQSWFMFRARTKPRGYPGDFELLEAIYDGQPKSTGLGGYLDLYFLETILCRGVHSRMKALSQFLKAEVESRPTPTSILNVASGSCREFRELSNWLKIANVKIACIDHDQAALDWSRAAVEQADLPSTFFDFHCYSALRMVSGKRNVEKFGKFDVIYSAGLFDYFPDDAVIAILRGLHETLSNGGVLCTPFKDAKRYDKTVYQWLVDWFFVQRTENECRRILQSAGFPLEKQQMQRDETGIIMIFVSKP